MLTRRLAECTAMMMIGDGVLAMVDPKRHMKLWQGGPPAWRKIMRPFVRNPGMTRWVGAAECAAGVWLAQCQRPSGRGSGA